MKSKIFTFKKVIHTGKWRSFEPENHVIKYEGKEVGLISQPKVQFTLSRHFQVSFTVKKEVNEIDPASFKWVALSKGFESVDDAKKYINEKIEHILELFDLYQFPKAKRIL